MYVHESCQWTFTSHWKSSKKRNKQKVKFSKKKTTTAPANNRNQTT